MKKKGGKTETVDAVLGQLTDEIPAELPPGESTKKQALVAPKPAGAEAKKDPGKKDEPKKEEAKKVKISTGRH